MIKPILTKDKIEKTLLLYKQATLKEEVVFVYSPEERAALEEKDRPDVLTIAINMYE